MKLFRYFQIATITFALALGNNTPAFCQPSQNVPSQIQKVKDQVHKVGILENVTVILLTGKEYYGSISKIEPDSFEIAEVDLKQKMAFDYKDVKKVRKGYGGRGFGGKRINPRHNLIAGIAVVGFISIMTILVISQTK
jgi:hypothetical protein